jgi:hypothetical protein
MGGSLHFHVFVDDALKVIDLYAREYFSIDDHDRGQGAGA